MRNDISLDVETYIMIIIAPLITAVTLRDYECEEALCGVTRIKLEYIENVKDLIEKSQNIKCFNLCQELVSLAHLKAQ